MKVHIFVQLIFTIQLVRCQDSNNYDSDADQRHLNYTLGLPEDLLYHLFTKKHPNTSFKVRMSTITNLKYSDFKAKKDTLFIIHGWKNDNESSVNYKIRETILEIHDINLFVVDWSKMAGRNYISARGSVVRVGQYVADFITQLKKRFGIKLEKVKFVGYSLGAHVCGNAGAALKGKVDRIVGLDPAGPLFTIRNRDNRLDETDARFVQVIHTNGGTLGFGSPIGHADYFPNGGSSQAGCGFDFFGSCAHARAYAYYAESLKSSKFISKQCGSYRDYTRGRCSEGDESIMGGFESDYRARGSYYLTTNSISPFARG